MIRTKITKYNSDTGEVFSSRDYASLDDYILKSDREFCKLFIKKEPELPNDNHLLWWYKLTRCLERNTNRLVEIHKGEIFPLTKNEILEFLNIKKTAYYKFLTECIERKIIFESKVKILSPGYYMSPVYVMNGKGISPDLYLLFKDDKQFLQLLSEKDKETISFYLGIKI